MRLSLALLVGCLALALSACTNPLDAEPGAARIPTGCGTCRVEIADLVATLEETPGVKAVTGTRRTTTGVPAAHLSIGVDLRGTDVVSTDVGGVVDAVVEAAWRSEVSPLDVLSLDVSLANGYSESEGAFFGRDRAAYEDRWGDRPPGSEWTPLTDETRTGEGCEPDGCTEVLRHVARDVSGLDGIAAVTRAEYAPSTPTDVAGAQVTVRVEAGAPSGLVDQVAEVVWRAEVWPIAHIVVSVEAGGQTDDTVFDVRPSASDHSRYEEAWGPRPAE